MEYYDNMVDALNALKKQGYTTDFNIEKNCLKYENNKGQLYPADFVVDKHFVFEDDSDADGSSILYAISSPKYKIKGVLVNGYGTYSDDVADELIEKLR